jgi:hypothetical protein
VSVLGWWEGGDKGGVCKEGFFLAGKLFTSSLKIPRRMFEGMIEELG